MNGWMVKQIKFYFQYFLLVLLVFFLLLSGCSITREALNTKERITVYAESLFKRQNLLTQQLMMLSEEDMSLADEEILSQAELQMYDACHLLNEYANREIEGRKMSVFFRRRVKNSLNTCEDGIKNMESVLMAIDEDIEKG